MDLTTMISQMAATNPQVGVPVTMQSTDNAILAGMVSGDTATSSLLGALFSQESEQAQLLASVQPNLGQNVNVLA